MLDGLYTAASGMLTQQRVLNVLANNMANVQTPGFRVERVVSETFEQTLLTRQAGNEKTRIGAGAPIRLVKDVQSIFDPSLLEATNRPFDMAINGEGFFHIKSDTQEFLTRNGNLDLDEEGYLVLRGAGRLLGESGDPIQPKTSNFTVDPDGTVYDDKGKTLDVVKRSIPNADVQLTKFANGLYTVEAPEANLSAAGSAVIQGVTERSNIDLNREYTMVMEAQRAFQACSSSLKIIDQINQKTASQIASI